MKKTELLSDLFNKWEDAHAQENDASIALTINGENISKLNFERDGIIEEEIFEKEKIKVLFISAEANVDGYGAKDGVVKSDYKEEYLDYYKSGKDPWRGKMRERISALYGYLTGQKTNDFSTLANKFAVMDLNKRGGKSTIDGGKHIVEYTKVYKKFMKEEITIIDPDIIVWIGCNTYDQGIPELLDCESIDGKKYFKHNNKKIPIIRMWQTSYVRARIDPIKGIIIKLSANNVLSSRWKWIDLV